MGQLEESRQKYGNGYYAQQLETGLQFQDVVTRELYQRGIVVVGYASRRFQMQHGENMLGAEIKRDGKFRGRCPPALWIETAEKAHPDRPEFTPSGICREDNAWLFVIGDEQTIWIFSTKFLRMLCPAKKYNRVETPTSQAWLLPLGEADKYCLRRIDMEDG